MCWYSLAMILIIHIPASSCTGIAFSLPFSDFLMTPCQPLPVSRTIFLATRWHSPTYATLWPSVKSSLVACI